MKFLSSWSSRHQMWSESRLPESESSSSLPAHLFTNARHMIMSLFHAHCHLKADPIVFEAKGQVFYDDANEYLISYSNGLFTVLSVISNDIPPQNLDFIRRAPVINVRISLDRQHICIQRSHTDVEITGLVNRNEATISCKGKSQGNMVHGHVWLNNELCDLVLITTQGLELLKLCNEGSDMKLVKHDKRTVHWFIYLHPARLLMLCTGKDQSTIQCFQFLPDRLLKLPDFDPESIGMQGNKRQQLERSSFVACKLYDKLCCIHICAQRQELVVYQLGKEAIGRLCTINLFTACEQFAVSVIDSLLIVHNTDSNITMVFDVWLQQWNSHPIVAPLPLGGPPLSKEPGESVVDSYESAAEVIDDWTFVPPSYILDKQSGKMWSLELNLEHIAAGCSDRGTLCRFLLKRGGAKMLLLRVLKSCIRDREGLHTLFQLFSVVIEAATRPQQHGTVAQGKWWFFLAEDGSSGVKEGENERTRRPVVTQEDMLEFVWLPLYDAHDVDTDYMMSVLTEYLRALSVHLQVPCPQLVQLVLDLSLGEECEGAGVGGGGERDYTKVQQLLQYHILPDSIPLAQRLLGLEAAVPALGCLGLDMLHRLRAHDHLARALLAQRHVIAAQRYMRRHAARVPPKEVLSAAAGGGDGQSFYWAYQAVVQEAHAAYQGGHRPAPALAVEDACDDYVALFARLFPPST